MISSMRPYIITFILPPYLYESIKSTAKNIPGISDRKARVLALKLDPASL